jgi:biotin carboxylase
LNERRVLLVAATTGYQTRMFGEAAERAGVRLVFATDRCDRLEDPWWDQAIPVRFHNEAASVRAIVDRVGVARPAGVLAVGDRPTVLAARAAEALGLRGHPPDAAYASRNKLACRLALQRAGLPVPWFRAVRRTADAAALAARVPYPCVIKPLALSGSRGVIRADTPGAFVAAFARVAALLRGIDIRIERDAAHDEIMIESFIPGREYALEGVLTEGVLRTLAIFDKPDPLDGPYFEETIYVTPSVLPEDALGELSAAVARAARALGLWHGPVHAEVRVNGEGIYVLEAAARPIGGLCARALRFDEGRLSLEELLLRHAVGEDVSGFAREACASGVMMIPIPRAGIYRDVEGVEAARAVPCIDDLRITAKPDQKLVPLPEGKSYLGFIFARAGTPGAVEHALREAHARLRFRIDRALL